ncbi:MAG: Hsp20/alpha crystallin family protein [Anaerolineaceae bacterium]
MTLYVTHPSALMEARRRMLRRLFEEGSEVERVMSFPVELTESAEEYVVKAFLPGLTSEDVNIQFSDGILSIDGEYKDLSEEKTEKLINEFPIGRFARSFEIANPILDEKIAASMSNGILIVKVPKAEVAKPRTIKIVAK